MTDSHDRLVFALSVLDGDEGAHRILADLLEEEGDRGLANWARARKGKRHKRLDFVLALLSYKTSLRLACDFAIHSLQLVDTHERHARYQASNDQTSLKPLVDAIEGIRAWSLGEISDQANRPHRSTIASVGPWAYGVGGIDFAMQSLHMAVVYAEIAESEMAEDQRCARHYACESRNSSRKVAKALREIGKPLVADLHLQLVRSGKRPLDQKIADLLTWQIDQTRKVINELLAERSD